MGDDLLRFVGIALAAALLGSLGGGFLTSAYDVSRSSSDFGFAAFIGYALFISFVGLVLAIPGALLIGAPLAWPFRRQIAAYPIAAALIYIPLGAVSGLMLQRWLDHSLFADRYEMPAMIFGGAVAAAFVLLVRVWRPAER